MTKQNDITGLARVKEIINALDQLDEFRATIVRLDLINGSIFGCGVNMHSLSEAREMLYAELGKTEHELRRGNHGETS